MKRPVFPSQRSDHGKNAAAGGEMGGTHTTSGRPAARACRRSVTQRGERPVGRRVRERLRDPPAGGPVRPAGRPAGLAARVEGLRAQGLPLAAVAARLNHEGFVPPKRAARFTGPMLTRLLCARRGSAARRPRAMAASELGSGEWWLGDFAKRLGSPIDTLRGWIRHGWVHARCVSMTSGARWVVWADEDECGFRGGRPMGTIGAEGTAPAWESGKTRVFFSGRCQGRWGPLVSGALAGRPWGGSSSVFRDGKTARSVEGGLPARQASGPPGKTVRAAAGSPPDLPATATDETVAKCLTRW